MKLRNLILIAIACVMMFAVSCSEEEGITYSLVDVSSRITGVSSDVTGPGASWTISGSQMDKVTRVFFDDFVVPSKNFTDVSESSITVTVPTGAPLGENEVLIVFPGAERATTSVTLVPLPAIVTFHPTMVAPGEPVTIEGANLGNTGVTGVNIGGVAATILSQSSSTLRFTVPAGMSTNKITLTGPVGTVHSANNLVACADDPNNVDCQAGLNLNPGLELGTADDFTNWGKWNGGQFMFATTQGPEVYRGNRALRVVRDGTLGDGQWRIQFSNDPATWEVGASYTVYVWARASAPGGSMRVSTNPNAMYTADQAVTTSWQRLAFTFPSANEASSRVVLDLNGNNTAVTTFFIDDVKLIKN